MPALRNILLFLALLMAIPAAQAGSAKVLKVLPHYLDDKGRMALNPSLFARDAYQSYLRLNPDKRSGVKFDVNWRGRGLGQLKLRLELRGARGQGPTTVTLEETVGSTGWFSKWTTLRFTEEQWKAFGELTAWRTDGTFVDNFPGLRAVATSTEEHLDDKLPPGNTNSRFYQLRLSP